MKLFKLALLLIILTGLVWVADAKDNNGNGGTSASGGNGGTGATGVTGITLSGTYDSGTSGPYKYNSTITATVTASDGSASVVFKWYAPGANNPSFTDSVTARPYVSKYNPTVAGDNWKVEASQGSSSVTAYFNVHALPEFPIGSFISLMLVCGLYLVLRRNMVGF